MGIQAIRIAVRSLRQAPAITAASILTLAIGIGANTAIFGVLYGVALRPLPYGQPERLVQVNAVRADGTLQNIALSEFDDWKDRSRTLVEIALVSPQLFALGNEAQTDAIRGAVVSEQFFGVLQVPMLIGRPLGAGDDTRPVAVVSERLWRGRLGADTSVLSHPLTLNGEPYDVIGVAPAGLQLPADDVDLWTPIGLARRSAPPQWNMRGFRAFSMIGRLAPGSDLSQAQEDASRIAATLAAENPRFNGGVGAVVTPLGDRIAGPVRPVLLMLFAVVALVLLVACANLANLALARGLARGREMAVRTALGATRLQVFTPLLAESGLVAAGGAVLGLGIARGLLDLLLIAPPANVPRLTEVTLDAPVLMFTTAVTVLSVILFGVAPAARLSRSQPFDALRDSGTSSAPGTERLHSILVVAQIAVCVVLLVGSALFARSLAALLRVDPGVRPEGVITARLDLTASAFADAAQQSRFLDRVLSQVSNMRGVAAAGILSSLPPNTSQMSTTMSVRNPRTGQQDEVPVDMIAGSEHVFAALGVPLLRGRAFLPADTADAPRVVIISRALARRVFADDDPIGRPMVVGGGPNGSPAVVVGVVGDVQYAGLDRAAGGAIYMPYPQRPFRATYLIVRPAGDRADQIARDLPIIIHEADPTVAVGPVLDLASVVLSAAAQPQLRTWLLAALSGIAMLLAAVGLYGVTSYGVSKRTVEIGMRGALGASRTDLLWMILRQGLDLTLAGLAIGAATAYGAARLVSGFLFDVQPTDPASFVLAGAFILLVCTGATLMPACRATSITPMMALRRR